MTLQQCTASNCVTDYGLTTTGWYPDNYIASSKYINWKYAHGATQTASDCNIKYKFYQQQILWNITSAATMTDGLLTYNYIDAAQTDVISCNFNFNHEETAAEKEARLAAEIERVAAKARAEDLLLMILGEKEKEQYIQHGYIETIVDDKVYRIKKGRSGNVFQLEQGIEKFRYCIHPSEYVPDQDTMIAQLLMLRNNEKEFLKTANRTILHVE